MQLVRAFAAICLGFIASLSLQGCSKTEEDTTAATATVTATTTATGETVTATATMTSTMTMTSTSTVTPAAWSERGDAGGIWGGFVTLQPLSLWVFCLAINLQFSRQKVARARLPKVDRWMLEWSVWRPFSYMSLISTFGILLGSLLWLGALWWTLAHWCTTMFLNCRSAGRARRCLCKDACTATCSRHTIADGGKSSNIMPAWFIYYSMCYFLKLHSSAMFICKM